MTEKTASVYELPHGSPAETHWVPVELQRSGCPGPLEMMVVYLSAGTEMFQVTVNSPVTQVTLA